MVHTEHILSMPPGPDKHRPAWLGLVVGWLTVFSLACLFWSSQALASRAVTVPAPPRGEAAAYLLMDADSGRLLVAKKPGE